MNNSLQSVGSNPVFSRLCCVRRRSIVMVSVGFCFNENGRLHFILDKAKVDAKLRVEHFSRNLLKSAESVFLSGFIKRSTVHLLFRAQLKFGINYLYRHDFGENKNNFISFLIVAGFLLYKWGNLNIKILHIHREIAVVR